MAVIELLVGLVTLAFLTVVYFKWSFGYWQRKGVPVRTPTIPFGNNDNFFKRKDNVGTRCKQHYDHFTANGEKHAGLYFFSAPVYFPIDPEYIKNVMVRDFEYFSTRGLYSNEKDDPLSANMFFIGGPKWKHLRTKLSPTFTSGKMKMMFNTVLECSKQMIQVIDGICEKKEPLNAKEMMACFTTDVISSTAFGLDCNSCKNPHEEFRKYGRKSVQFTKLQSIQNSISVVFPNMSRALGIRLIARDAAEYFMNVVKNTVEYREKNNFFRKDFMQLLIGLKEGYNNNNNNINEKNNSKGLTMDEIAAQAFIFYVGGFETSSLTLSFSLLEMSLNKDIQEKARDEVNEVLERHNGEITYEAVQEMKYIQQVMDETLRKYPILPVLNRECVKNYKVPGTDTILDKGTPVFISVLGMHYNPEYFPDPETFDPERFSEENKSNIKPFTYFPFGEGPRVCIGLRFGIMQTKLGLAALLSKYRFSLNDKTELPLKYDPFAFTMAPLNEICLNVEKISSH